MDKPDSMFEGKEGSDTLNREELLHLAIRTARQNPQGARVMFQQVLAEDKRNERALLWMASLSKKKQERREYLQRALKVNPRSRAALREMERLDRQEKARANRTLIYGGLLIVAAVLLIILVVVVAMNVL
jgi:Tfp pilus assembly protein PilF